MMTGHGSGADTDLQAAGNIATLVISIAVIMVAYEIGRGALLGGDSLPDTSLALPVAIGSLVVATASSVKS